MKKFYSLLILLLFVLTAWSQTRIYNGGNGSWNDPTKWTPMGVPVSSDVIEFNGISATISNVPALDVKGIIVTGSSIVLKGAGNENKKLTVGQSGTDTAIIINQDASLSISNNLSMAIASNSIAIIDGTLIVSSDGNYYTNSGGTTKTIVNGTIRNNGNVVSVASMLEFKNNSVYEHARDKGILPYALWDKNSTCSILGITANAPGGLDQVFGNYTWDCEQQVAGIFQVNAIPSVLLGDLVINRTGPATSPGIYLQLPGKIEIGGALIVNSGTCLAKETGTTIDLSGNLIVTGGTLKPYALVKASVLAINFVGTHKQLFQKTGGEFKITKFNIVENAMVDFGESVLDGDGDFILSDGGKLLTAHPAGISLSGSTGAIQVAGKRIFSNGADYAFTGSVAQQTGTGLPATVRKLIIDNKAGLASEAGVILSKATTVSKELVLDNGFLQTSNENMLTIADGAKAITGDNSFVSGPMRKAGNSSFTFPTGWAGPGGGRIPIGITPKDATTIIQAEYKRAPATARGATINAPLHHISYCEYWELFPISGKSNAVITMYRNAHSNCHPVSYINDFSSVRVARSNGNAWTQIGNTRDSLDAGSGYVVSDDTGIVLNESDRYFALGHITTARDPLPVLFDNVMAYAKNEGVNIEWSNLTERDMAIYFVERSLNGMDYTLIGQHLPKSNRDDKASYINFDANPLRGTNFYRIKAIDKTTKIIFSKVMRVETGKAQQKLSLYPNPVTEKQFILSLTDVKEGAYTIRISNAVGQYIHQGVIINTGNFLTQTLKLPSSAKPGVYNVMITGGNDYRENKMFIVQ